MKDFAVLTKYTQIARAFLAALVVNLAIFSHSLANNIELTTGADYAPYTSDELVGGGVITEVMSLVFAHMGHPPSVTYQPWARGYKSVLRHIHTGTFPYAWSRERDALFLYSTPVNIIKIRPYMHRDVRIKFEQPGDLAGLIYCQPLGYQTEAELQAMIDRGELKRFEANDMDHCFQMLEKKHVDVVISNDLVAFEAIRRTIPEEQRHIVLAAKNAYRQTTEHLIIAKDYPNAEQLMRDFNSSYSELLEDGQIDTIWLRHLGMESGQKP